MFARTRSVHILIFDDVEVLDFCGPFEVFSVAGRRQGIEPFQVYTIAPELRPVMARGGLSINPDYCFADCPKSDMLLVPGGPGTRMLVKDETVVNWVKTKDKDVDLVLSVCSGALVLGRAGLLNGLAVTTHCGAMDELKVAAPQAVVQPTKRVIDNGRVIVSAGISAGIDLSLYIVESLLGTHAANETAQYLEYDWKRSVMAAG